VTPQIQFFLRVRATTLLQPYHWVCTVFATTISLIYILIVCAVFDTTISLTYIYWLYLSTPVQFRHDRYCILIHILDTCLYRFAYWYIYISAPVRFLQDRYWLLIHISDTCLYRYQPDTYIFELSASYDHKACFQSYKVIFFTALRALKQFWVSFLPLSSASLPRMGAFQIVSFEVGVFHRIISSLTISFSITVLIWFVAKTVKLLIIYYWVKLKLCYILYNFCH
jgi:hypothetical protein